MRVFSVMMNTTETMMSAAAITVEPVTRSRASNAPTITAINGFTYEWLATFDAGTWCSSQE